jgi:hypothetical protein
MTQSQNYKILNSDLRDIVQNCGILQIKELVISWIVSCEIRDRYLKLAFYKESAGRENVFLNSSTAQSSY